VKKIAYIVSSGNFLGGAERSFYELVIRLNKSYFEPYIIFPFPGNLADDLRSNGFNVKIFDFPKWSLENPMSRLNILGIRMKNPFWHILNHICYIPMAIKISDYLVKNRFDLVHNNSIHPNMFGSIAARLANIPYIAHIREFGTKKSLFGKLYKMQYQNIIRHSVYCIATSDSIKSYYQNANDNGKIITIPNPVDCNCQRLNNVLSSNEAKKMLKIPTDVPIIGIVGRITPLKGHITLLKAANIVREKGYPHARFLVVGDVDKAPKDYLCLIYSTIQKLGLSDNVIFTGFCNDVSTIYSAIDILAVPSQSESFGLVVVEGMAAGKCVIATNLGGPSEIIIDGINGFLIPPENPKILAEKILYVLQNLPEAQMIAQKAKEKAQDFNPDHYVESIESLYMRILENGNSD